MKKIRLASQIFALAAIAGLIRYLLTSIFDNSWATVVINFSGIFLLVFGVKGYLPYKGYDSHITKLIGLGFLGSLTSLAGPLLELARYLQAEDWRRFSLSLAIHVIGGACIAYGSWLLSLKLEGGRND